MSRHSDAVIPANELIDQGFAHLRSGRFKEAIVIADQLLAADDVTAKILTFAGEVQFKIANFTGAEKLARQYSECFPGDPAGPILRCRALLALGRMREGRKLAIDLSKQDITNDAHIEILVTVLSTFQMPELAYPLCRKSLEQDPTNVAAHRRLALTCRLLGKFDEAVGAASVAIKANPHDYEMIGLRSAVRTATTEQNSIPQLREILAGGCRDSEGASRVAYAIAKECEEIGLAKQSFGYLEAGAKFKRETFNYDIADDLKTFDTLREVFSGAALDGAKSGFCTDEPVFVLGLPRTGSTLVERIISSHSAVFAAGELHHFGVAMMGEVRKAGNPANHADLVRKSLDVDMREVGRNYLEMTRPATGHTKHFIDKRPLNFMSIGIISVALPNAKIIHVRRTPMDTCYAIYKFRFNQAYPWAYNLAEIAQYYVAYRQLMNHWRQVLPGRIIEVAYEDVVSDLQVEAKRLISELNLDWEPACLEFHENKAAAMTGSATQIRKKIYSSSVGRWRDYESQLKPLAEALASTGIDPFSP